MWSMISSNFVRKLMLCVVHGSNDQCPKYAGHHFVFYSLWLCLPLVPDYAIGFSIGLRSIILLTILYFTKLHNIFLDIKMYM